MAVKVSIHPVLLIQFNCSLNLVVELLGDLGDHGTRVSVEEMESVGSEESGVLVVNNLCWHLVHSGFWTAMLSSKYVSTWCISGYRCESS